MSVLSAGLRTLAFAALVFFFFYFLFSGIVERFSEPERRSGLLSDISVGENWWIGEENPDVCRIASVRQCFNLKNDADFLYQNESEVSVIIEEIPADYAAAEPRQPSPEQELAARVFYQKLAELENAPQPEAEAEEDLTENLAPETLDKIYEEELPTDVIVEEQDDDYVSPELLAEGYHIYRNHKNVKQLNIIPKYKPAYFGDKPVIVVVIDDMGISQKRTHDIISLNAPLTASFLTYGRALDRQVAEASAAGMEIMLHAPMEPHSNADIAPDTLTTAMSAEEVKRGLEVMLSKFRNIRGINNHMGSKLTEDMERMNAVMEVLKEKDLFFLDSKTSAFSVGKKAARQNGVAYATRHVFLDNENNVPYILKQLAIAERIARRNGYAVAIGHPKTGTYQALKEWLPTLEEKNIRLTHLSEVVEVLRKSRL